MVIQSREWFVALTGSMLVHILLIQFMPSYQLAPIVKRITESTFTVMLADPEILEKLVLDQPEAITSEVVPMISLDDSPQPLAESVSPGVALEVVPVEEPAGADADMDQQPVVELEAAAPVEEPAGEDAEMEEQSTVELEATVPRMIIPISTELTEVAVDTVSDLSIVAMQPVDADEGLMIPNVSLDNFLPSTDITSFQTDEAEVILAEIEIEQIHFEELEMESLPEIQAEELKFEAPVPQIAETSDSSKIKTTTVAKKRGGKSWRKKYSGATGVGFAYRDKMRLKLNGLTIYPKTIAEKHLIEGRVVVRFVLNRAGELLETEIIESSNHVELDDAVKQMIQIAQPFAPLPDEMKNDKVAFAFPVTIELSK